MRAFEVPTAKFPAAMGVAGVIVLGGAAALLLMGRPPICACGYVKLWEGQVFSAGNSQHIADWYTFTHISHGFLLYFLLWLGCHLTGRTFNAVAMFVAAIAIETVWEVLENTNFIIDRYRDATPAFGYYGDSVLNSVSDIAAMAIGFFAAARFPIWLTVAVAAVMEIGLALAIRDNFALNIIMLLYPFEAIRDWQQAIVK